MNTESRGAFSVWRDAARFHLRYWRHLAGIFPLLLVPVLGDLLHSLLIRQSLQQKNISCGRAFRDGWGNVLSLLAMKLSFEVPAFLWGLIPIYGYIKAIQHRLYWGMASNVMVFEGLSGTAARNRCCELIDKYSHGSGARALVIVPSLILVAILLAWTVSGSVYEPLYSYGFLIFLAACFWVAIPGSGAANTFFYLQLIESAKSKKDETDTA